MSQAAALRAWLDALRRRAAAARAALRDAPDPRRALEDHPLAVLTTALLLAYGVATAKVIGALGPRERLVLKDSVIFEYIGWRLAAGDRLYVDMWEVKPPVSFELAGVVALLTGENVLLYHTVLVALGALAAVAAGVLVGALVHEVTGDGPAAVVAGLVPLLFPPYFIRPLVGYKAKFLVVAFGLAALYLALRDRPLGAGVAGALAAGTWQLAVVFPVVALGLVRQRSAPGDRRPLGRFLAGAAATTALVLLPFLWWGWAAVEALVAEVLLTPLLISEDGTATDRLRLIVRTAGKAYPVFLLGALGLARSVLPDVVADRWWALAAGGWYALTMLFFDFDTRMDFVPWLVFGAIGVGFVLARVRASPALADGGGDARSRSATGASDARRALSVTVALFAVVSVVTLGGFGAGNPADPPTYTLGQQSTEDLDLPYNRTERQTLFWNRVPPETCRVFAGVTQFRLVKKLDRAEPRSVRYFEVECGLLGPAWRAVARQYG